MFFFTIASDPMPCFAQVVPEVIGVFRIHVPMNVRCATGLEFLEVGEFDTPPFECFVHPVNLPTEFCPVDWPAVGVSSHELGAVDVFGVFEEEERPIACRFREFGGLSVLRWDYVGMIP